MTVPPRPWPTAMDRVNPLDIPRNHLVQEALGRGGEGDLASLAQQNCWTP